MRSIAYGLSLVLFAAGCGGSFSGPSGAGGSGGDTAATTGTMGGGGATTTTSTIAGGGGAGGAVTTTGTTSSTTSSSTTSDAGGSAPNSGDCASDTDCPGSQCVEVTPGGFRVCLVAPEKATTCDNPGLDQCCSTQPCPDNQACYVGPIVPYCGGIQPPQYNQCAADQCAIDGDCSGGAICGVAGTLGRSIRACVPASCKHDGDCAAEPGGKCEPVANPCCGAVQGLYCVYPNGGCRSNDDCASGQYCSVVGERGLCQTGGPICPA